MSELEKWKVECVKIVALTNPGEPMAAHRKLERNEV
jgi:hypothetical protein